MIINGLISKISKINEKNKIKIIIYYKNQYNNMYVYDILLNIRRGKNQAIYGQDMYKIYTKIVKNLQPTKNQDKKYCCIYIDTQTDKEIIIKSIETIKNTEAGKLKEITQEKLLKILIATLANTQLVIVYNYLEDMSNKREQLFQRLMRHDVLFIAGFQKLPKKNRMPFFNSHIFVNKEYFDSQKGEDNIDITYFFYIFITLFIVLIFLRIVSLERIGDIIASALWFGLLVFRTFSYIGGKV